MRPLRSFSHAAACRLAVRSLSAACRAATGTVAGVVRDAVDQGAGRAGAVVEIAGRAGDHRRRRAASRLRVAGWARSTVGVTASGYYAARDRPCRSASAQTHRGRVRARAATPASRRRVDVVAPAPAAAPATQEVAPVQVLRTPGALDNVFRTLQTLPGVARHRGVRQPAGGARRLARSEPHDDGRRRDPRPVSAVRADERLQPRDHPALRAGHRRLQRQVRRPAVVAAARREPRRHAAPSGSPARRRSASPTPTSCSKAGCPAAPRVVAGHRPPHLLRPGRRAAHRQPVPGLRRPAGQGACGSRRRHAA